MSPWRSSWCAATSFAFTRMPFLLSMSSMAAPPAPPGVPSIAGLKFEDKTPVPVLQAEAAINIIERLGAGQVNPAAVKKATVALGEAKAAKDDKAIADASQRSISAAR